MTAKELDLVVNVMHGSFTEGGDSKHLLLGALANKAVTQVESFSGSWVTWSDRMCMCALAYTVHCIHMRGGCRKLFLRNKFSRSINHYWSKTSACIYSQCSTIMDVVINAGIQGVSERSELTPYISSYYIYVYIIHIYTHYLKVHHQGANGSGNIVTLT